MAKAKEDRSTTDGESQRDSRGLFLPGNKVAKGNPHGRRVAKIRGWLLDSVDASDVRKVIKALVAEAEKGNVAAARELLDRLVGKPIEIDLLERIEELEALLLEKAGLQ